MEVGKPFLATITPLTDPGGGQPPLGIWGPTDPRPSNPISGPVFPGSPGYQPPGGGGQPPGSPTFPIWGPPGSSFPGGPGYPPVATQPPLPEAPPPDETPPTGPLEKMTWQTVWTEEYGWAVIGLPVDPHPVPSASKKAR